MFWLKLCKSTEIMHGTLCFLYLSHLLYGLCAKIFIIMNRYISKSYTTSKNTIERLLYRAGAAVMSTITSIKEDDKGNCDYQDDWDDWSGWDDQDHEIVMVTLVTRMTRVGGIRWMSLWLGYIGWVEWLGYLWWLGWQGWQLSRITRLTGMTRMRLIPCQTPQSQNKVSHTSLDG